MSFSTGTQEITEMFQLQKQKQKMKNRLILPRGSLVKVGVRLRMCGCKELKEEE